MTQPLLQSLREQLSDPLLVLQPLSVSGNSRVCAVSSTQHGEMVVKNYISDGRKRMETEYGALQLLFAHGLPVPQPLCAVPHENYALYKRLVGRRVSSKEIPAELITGLLDFLRQLHGLRHKMKKFAHASEACFSPAEVASVLQQRRRRFVPVTEPTVQSFLTEGFDQLTSRLNEVFRRQCGVDFNLLLPQVEQTLSPSDFGFHNTLLTPNGRLVFVDFEFFGWDDPAKLMADFLWHPAMDLTVDLKKQFVAGCQDLYGADCFLRWHRSHALHGLKWVLLMLNEFIADDWHRRQFAGEHQRREERLAQQLNKARQLLVKVEEESERNPYVD